MVKTVMLAAHDVSPSKAFERITIALKQQGVKTNEWLLHGKDESPNGIYLRVRDADLLLVGMSSPAKNAELELAVADQALQQGVAIALFADTFGAWNREWFAPLRDRVKVLFIASEPEVKDASRVFPNAKVFATGNPIWDPYFLPASREDARKRLGVKDDEVVVLIPGSKGLAINVSLLEMAADALSQIDESHSIRAFFARHPGEPKSHEPFYDELYSDPLFDLASKRRIEELSADLASDEVVPGVDGVFHAGNSSVGLHALCRRIPVIDVPCPLAKLYLERECGGILFTPGAMGATERHHDPKALPYLLQSLRQIRGKGPPFLPPREQGASARQIADALIEAMD